jgi:hypothetical protein
MRVIIALSVSAVVGCASPNTGAVSSGPGPDVRMRMPQATQVLSVGASVVQGVAPASYSGDYIKCATTGGLGQRLVRLVEAQIL